ncbi:hypothetical protein QMG83_06935 [Salinibacterium sp. G-O1]|uniref:hypothetical protein n=1 Tax=Salinibacterium sp. G-O1 TaxID=3046208 RepID=UPI0024BB6E2B|nr:hypothetical protein [Salinibacterium sp. G-O1]MDJ0334955.1 hypothetical protein [Salinibacterium sp. G-O1]
MTSTVARPDAPDPMIRCEAAAGEELAAARHGTEQAFVDSPWQLPGEFVIDSAGIVQLAYRYQYCKDWPDPRVLTAAIRFGGRRTRVTCPLQPPSPPV